MKNLKKEIFEKERELELLLSELSTKEEFIIRTNSVIDKLTIFKELAKKEYLK